jgi:hypothetical protein
MVISDRHWRVAIHTLAALAIAFLLVRQAAAEELTRSFPANQGGQLRIALDFGRVEVVPTQAEDVRIEARARGVGASGVHFDTRAEGDDVVLTSRAEPWVALLQSAPSVQVRAFVPAAWSIDVADNGRSGSALGAYLVHQP